MNREAGMGRRTRRISTRAVDGARVLWRRAARVSDAGPTKSRRAARIRTDGFTVLELLVAVSLFSIITAIAMPRAPHSGLTLWNANEQLLGDLRRTRADALTRGDHFVLEVTSTSAYQERRMQLVGNNWLPVDPPVRTRTLPSGITFTVGVGERFEFNTRGLLVIPDAAGSLSMQDAISGHARQVTVWPSGQVMAS